MRSDSAIAASALALLLLSGCGKAAPPRTKPSAAPQGEEAVARAARYRVAGVGLMMTPVEARDSLRAAGYRSVEGLAALAEQPSFEDRVVERNTGKWPAGSRQVPAFETFRKEREKIDVWYGPFPGGAAVTRITYDDDGPSPSPEDMRAALEERYGKPTVASRYSAAWCAPAPCGEGSVRLDVGSGKISLNGPSGFADDWGISRRVDAAARKAAPAGRGSF